MDLVDRQGELDQLDAVFRAAEHESGRAVAVEGPPGIGKTRLVEAAVECAQAHGFETLFARGDELEADYPFGVVRQLLERRIVACEEPERSDLLAGAAGLAAPIVGAAAQGSGSADEFIGDVVSYPRLRGLYWLVANLAARRPLLLAVDDVHWADAPSLRWIGYEATRVSDLPVVLLLACRPVAHEGVGGELDNIIAGPATLVLRPLPLADSTVRLIVRDRLGHDAADAFCDACVAATGGNPFFLHELLSELARAGVRPTWGAAARVTEVGPSSVARSVLRRLSALGRDSLMLARAIAVLGERADHRHVHALAGVETTSLAADLVDAGILASGAGMRFVHPVVRSAIYSSLSTAMRADLHARAARILHEDRASTEAVAIHLLATPPGQEPWVIELLREAAARATERGTPAAAVDYLRRALAEPSSHGHARSRLLAELGRAEVQAGEPTALDTLHEALAGTPAPDARATIALDLGRALTISGRVRDAVDLLADVLDNTEGLDDDTALRMEAELVNAGRLDARSRPLVLERLARAGIGAQMPGKTPGERLLLAHHAYEAVSRGERADLAVDLARRALGEGALLEESGPSPAYAVAAWSLALCDRLQEAEDAFTAGIVAAREQGSAVGFMIMASFRASVHVWRGTLADAEADARNVMDAMEHGWHPLGVAFLVDTLVERGQLDEAETALTNIGMLGAIPESMLFQQLLYARGELRLAQRRTQEGTDDLLEGGRRARTAGITTAAFRPWRSAAAIGLAALGRFDNAWSLASEELRLAREAEIPRAEGIALRAVGLLQSGAEGLETLEQSLAALERSESRLAKAWTLVELGAARRRRGQRVVSRQALREGLDLAHRLGADRLAERARDELAATGARPRRAARRGAEALTPSERRVALLATEGMSNREIAQSLFVTLKTVEWHLGQVYRKLEISGRSDLTAAITATADDRTVVARH
jgi:DNA-binding CsgD family transcriptional regulator